MTNKTKGFTLIEVLVTLALTSMILGLIYSIMHTNNLSLIETDIKSTLQAEAEDMQRNISKYGMQAMEIEGTSLSIDINGEVKKLILVVPTEAGNVSHELSVSDKLLKLDGRILSRNLKSFKVEKSDGSYLTSSGETTGLKSITFKFILAKKQGYSDVEYPVSITVNFRNAN